MPESYLLNSECNFVYINEKVEAESFYQQSPINS